MKTQYRIQSQSYGPCKNGCDVVHVAFNRNEPERRGDEREVTFLSFHCHTSQLYTHETGVQFCCFECTDEVSSGNKSSLNFVWIMHSCYPIQGEVFHSKGSLLWCFLIGRYSCVIAMLMIARRDLCKYIVPSLKMCCLNHNVIFCQL